jgi:hypothetical protein
MEDMAKSSDPKKDEPTRPEVDLTPHPLVAKLISNAANPTPDAVTLEGYLGPSSREGYVRVYLDLTFKAYFEIPKNGIVHADKPDPSNESKPTTIVIDPATKLDLVHSLDASYLKGKIAAALTATKLTKTCFDLPTTIAVIVTKRPCVVSGVDLCVSVVEVCSP